MARTKGFGAGQRGHTGNTTDDDDSGDAPPRDVKQEPHAGCSRKRAPSSPDEVHRRGSYDAAAVHRSDALRALRNSRLAVDEAIRSLEHAASTAAKAFDSEVDASNETRASLSKRRHVGEPANDRGQGGQGGGF